MTTIAALLIAAALGPPCDDLQAEVDALRAKLADLEQRLGVPAELKLPTALPNEKDTARVAVWNFRPTTQWVSVNGVVQAIRPYCCHTFHVPCHGTTYCLVGQGTAEIRPDQWLWNQRGWWELTLYVR